MRKFEKKTFVVFTYLAVRYTNVVVLPRSNMRKLNGHFFESNLTIPRRNLVRHSRPSWWILGY